ncbi:MAG: Y-family DNA polymerase [Bacteroidales bacterium]|nr:Y-family DNA polymerase [Candidatus Colimorpha merdihippi]
MTYFAVVDCDNCYVSCERVFRPDLNDKPVVVLSNNDGCVVARSNEAKQLGIKAGTPYFKLAQEFPNQKIAVFSSNYELYGDLTARVMTILHQESPEYFRYSIDEAFVVLRHTEGADLKKWGEELHVRIKKAVGIPVSIGIGPTKTLAKMASHFAKHYKGYHHCCLIDTEEKRVKALSLYPISEVWGIGRRYAAKLNGLGVNLALDFARMSKEEVQSLFNVVGTRTWRELNGEDCVPNEEPAKKKSICVSRSFPGMISDYEVLRRYISNYAARCSEKLRVQGTAASVVGVFLSTNPFREDLQQYNNFYDIRLLTPSNSSITIVKQAEACFQKIYKEGFMYKRAGVVLMSMEYGAGIQTNFLDYDAERFEKMKRLDKVIDRLNRIGGTETVILGSQQFPGKGSNGKSTLFADAIKHDYKSPNYTTRWTDIIELK